MVTLVSSVESFNNAHLIASKLPLVSAFSTIFNCFKFPDFILSIIISIDELAADFFDAISSLYSSAFTLAFSISETT